jgi:DMSO/TMAO reductase YedYZ molybdopterin-dependent catalytic subunit
MPAVRSLVEGKLLLADVTGHRLEVSAAELQGLPRVQETAPLVCQIFNWSEKPEVEGIRLSDLLDSTGIDAPEEGFFGFYSADGLYFEGLPRSLARDPRTLLVFGLNGKPLPLQYGGPLRLWVPFLQGYKSVKWLCQVRAYRRDPMGIKRLLGQSRTAILGADGQETASVVVARPLNGDGTQEI